MIIGTRANIAAEMARQARLSTEIARGQAQISSEKRLLAPSDDPAASARVANIRRVQANEAAWAGNVQRATALAEQADTTLGDVSTALDHARALALQAASDTLTDSDRAAIRTELQGIAEQLAELAATTDSQGNRLFATGPALSVPIGEDMRIAPVASAGTVFGGVDTADGPRAVADILADALAAVAIADPAERRAAIDGAVAGVEAAVDHVAAARADHGIRMARIEAAGERLAVSKLQRAEERSALEETDIAATVAEVQARLLSLEAAQAAFTRITRQTLFDLMG